MARTNQARGSQYGLIALLKAVVIITMAAASWIACSVLLLILVYLVSLVIWPVTGRIT